jgi:hypothetical protein
MPSISEKSLEKSFHNQRRRPVFLLENPLLLSEAPAEKPPPAGAAA